MSDSINEGPRVESNMRSNGVKTRLIYVAVKLRRGRKKKIPLTEINLMLLVMFRERGRGFGCRLFFWDIPVSTLCAENIFVRKKHP